MILAIAGASIGLALGGFIGVALSKKKTREQRMLAELKAENLKKEAQSEAKASLKAAVNDARAEMIAERKKATQRVEAKIKKGAKQAAELDEKADQAESHRAEVDDRWAEIDEAFDAVKSKRDRARGLWSDIETRREKRVTLLAERAEAEVDAIVSELSEGWRNQVRSHWTHRIRELEQSSAEPWVEREARRLMSIASSRYQNHFLTEKNRATLRLDNDTFVILDDSSNGVLEHISKVSTINMLPIDEGQGYRMDGLDGVGREVVRRAFKRLAKKEKDRKAALESPEQWAQKLRDNLENEIRSLGRKAFNVLKIDKAHDEIVELVGALNYRTSYTQNQWLHAVEASFLAGMMADELGLDIKLARRATLMHDIGKALTHKIEGSHAVIGADIARRLGEDEVVANAIGSHHADEPPNSVYAYLVAASDAMSGARPGARREQTDGFSTKVEDLQRIAKSYRGVDQAHAVHGGRELRVYVKDHVTDADVVELSEEISERVSDEMTFPGQIKVTVIREYEAVTTTV